jgi:hypothetical protein
MDVKKLFWPCVKIRIGNGEKCRFWEDVWLGHSSLANMFPRVYSISLNQHIRASIIRPTQQATRPMSSRADLEERE